ncbi:AI-2E family transporter [Mesorhizobium sp. BAC0120]|uniref:AI-2E family transporter n=1 Tax=Mesorhizobium sp. BAC0120 TaxID=3090670 RepID=UPI00298BF67F|nr:AI-2E family transporter [Mesorhizobium sp. BAC0120]MDW6025937.1 AI-2E family transporter [Mesorhizobium sp. BAC0120]
MEGQSDASEAGWAGRTALVDARLVHFALIGIFILSFASALYFARDFFMPVVLAFLLALTLSPVVRFMAKRGIPAALSATLLVLVAFAAIGSTGYLLSAPVVQLISDAPSIGRQVTEKLSEFRRPFQHLLGVFQQVEQLTEVVDQPGVNRVVVAQPAIVSQAAGTLASAATSLAIMFVLSLFLLASGTMFYEKIVQSFAKLSEKKRALRIMYDVEREISRYLLTIALINSGLGLAVGLGLWVIGMPNPLLWGVAAGLLNFLPYVGATLTILTVAAMALVSFDSMSYALLAPAYIMLCDIIEGQVVTPFVLGRRLEINAVAIFIAVAFWSWLWGFVGALIAVPLLVAVKVFCDHFESLHHVGNFLSAQQAIEEPQPAEAEGPAS